MNPHDKLNKFVVVSNGCHEWTGVRNQAGYGMTTVFVAGRRVLTTAHRAQWLASRGAIPAGMHVLHDCDNPCCINIRHLWLGTPLDNVRDMKAKGRSARQRGYIGPGRPPKLTADQRVEIIVSTEDAYTLAYRYGVDSSTIHRLRQKRTRAELRRLTS